MNERFERFAVRLGVACGMVALCLTAGAWDVEHDEIAQLTGECLPSEIKAQFDFGDFGVLMANCHFPDGTEWEPRRFRDLDDLEAIVDTLSLRNKDVVAKLIDVLNALASNPEHDVADLLWGKTDKP